MQGSTPARHTLRTLIIFMPIKSILTLGAALACLEVPLSSVPGLHGVTCQRWIRNRAKTSRS